MPEDSDLDPVAMVVSAVTVKGLTSLGGLVEASIPFPRRCR